MERDYKWDITWVFSQKAYGLKNVLYHIFTKIGSNHPFQTLQSSMIYMSYFILQQGIITLSVASKHLIISKTIYYQNI